MRYQIELEIEAPRERVLDLFLDPENLTKWQPSLVRYEQLGDGDARRVGAQSKQLHRMGSREVEMIQTITVDDYPDTFAATYESDDVWNLIENRFTALDNNRTGWALTSDFRSTSFMMKVFMVFFPGMFKRQTRTFMDYFKAFVEAEHRSGHDTTPET